MQGDFTINDDKALTINSPKSLKITTKRKGTMFKGPLVKRNMLIGLGDG
jgi:hypothetical protein